MRNRGSPSPASVEVTRLWPTSVDSASRTSTSSSTAPIASAVSSVQPPAQTESRASNARSGSASRSWLQAIVSRRVRWRSGASTSPREVQRPVQPAQQHCGRQRAHPGGDQFDGERQALQPPDHLGERRGVLLGDGEGRIGALGPRGEQLDGGGRGHLLHAIVARDPAPRAVRAVRSAPRAAAAGFGWSPAAGWPGTATAGPPGLVRREHVLGVVQHQQAPAGRPAGRRRAPAAGGAPRRRRRPPLRSPPARRPGAQRREVDPPDGVAIGDQRLGRGEGQPRLAYPAGAGERHQPHRGVAQQPGHQSERRRDGRPAARPASAASRRPGRAGTAAGRRTARSAGRRGRRPRGRRVARGCRRASSRPRSPPASG